MKFLLKLVLSPIVLFLTITAWLSFQIVKLAAIVLNFAAIALVLGSMACFSQGNTGNGIAALVIAFLLCPFGLPMLASLLIANVQIFRDWLWGLT